MSTPTNAPPTTANLLQEERWQLQVGRWGLLLLATYYLLQIVITIGSLVSMSEKPRYPEIFFWALTIGSLLLVAFPSLVLLYLGGRSSIWRHAALTMGALVLLQVALVGVFVSQIEMGGERPETPPFFIVLLTHGIGLLDWGIFWWSTIIGTEFGKACRSRHLVVKCESIGYAIVTGFTSALGLAVWVLPVYQRTDSADLVAALLELTQFVCFFVVVIWLFRLLALESMVARLLITRSGQIQDLLPDE